MTTDWPAPDAGLYLIAKWERFEAKPYLCAAGVPSIGYGTTRYPDGRRVTLADPEIDEATAHRYLLASAERVARDLRPLIYRLPTAGEWGALLSLAYNCGVGCHDGVQGDIADSTLLRLYNAGNIEGAAKQFPRWNKAHVHGVLTPLLGLTRRRLDEQRLFLSGPPMPAKVARVALAKAA